MTETAFKPGDYVIWIEGGSWSRHDVWGKVVRVTPKGTVFARRLGATNAEQEREREFRNGRGLREPTMLEVQRRIWRRNAPKTTIAHVSYGLGHNTKPSRVYFDPDPTTPEQMRQAAAELATIATWWESEPKESDAEPDTFDWTKEEA